MASEHEFHLGPKTQHAQGDLLDKTEQQPASATSEDAQRRAGEVADGARETAQEGKEHAGNVFQKAGGALQNAVNETVQEVKSKLGKTDSPANEIVED